VHYVKIKERRQSEKSPKYESGSVKRRFRIGTAKCLRVRLKRRFRVGTAKCLRVRLKRRFRVGTAKCLRVNVSVPSAVLMAAQLNVGAYDIFFLCCEDKGSVCLCGCANKHLSFIP
jgi:hypothetical protein